MKKILLLSLLFMTQFVGAQQEKYVSGQILDSINKQPMAYCAVGFYNQKKELIKGVATDEKGFFSTSLSNGFYSMMIDYLGYKKKTIPVRIYKNNQFLGKFHITPDDNQLKTVVLKGSTKKFEVDKYIYTVTSKMKVSAANTNDVLDKIKGVNYDRYNNLIKVDGDTNVKILVNGLEKDLEYIQNLNPDRIKKIEVIRDPGGRYGLQGFSALINVILKQNYVGTEINFNNQSIIDPDAYDKAYILPANNMTLTYNYTYNKVNVYTKYSQYVNNFSFPMHNYKSYSNGTEINRVPKDDKPNFFKKAINDRFVAGADYYINPLHTLSFETSFSNIFFNKNEDKGLFLLQEFQNNILTNESEVINDNDTDKTSNYQSVFYVGKLSDNDDLTMDMTLSSSKDESLNTYLTDGIEDRTTQSNSTNSKFVYNAQWTHQLSNKSNIQFGYGLSRLNRTGHTKLNFTQLNTHSNTDFDYKDLRNELYAYYATKFSKKLSLKLGLAGEMSLPEALGNKTRYFIYQPYLDLKYKLTKKVDLKLKYRSDSDYPSLEQVNPSEIYMDAQSVSIGNPNLKPSVKHKLSLRTNFMNGVMFIEPYYHFSSSYIGQIGRLRNDGLIEYTYDNVGKYLHYGVKASFAIPLGKTIFWQNNVNYYKSSITYNNHINALKDWSLNSNLMYVNRKNGITSGFIYQRGMNKYISTQGYHKWNNDFMAVMFQKPFMKKRLNLMLLYMLPVERGIDFIQGDFVSTPNYSSENTYDIHLLKNVVVFRLNYRFNKGKTIRKTKKDIPQEKEPKKNGIF